MARTPIQAKYNTRFENGKVFIDVNLKNTGKSLSFFTQIQWLDKSGSPVRPSFYSDNFVNLLPGESVSVRIETGGKQLAGKEYLLVVKGFNVLERRFLVGLR